jgi:Cft2 family RNA processing exonuclease
MVNPGQRTGRVSSAPRLRGSTGADRMCRNVHNTADSLYTEADHLASYSRIEAIDYHTTLTHHGISITPYHAGHVLGGAMFMIEIAGLKILFTGDYSREDDRHLVSAEVPPVKPDILICESTYGTASHMPRLEKEARLMKLTTDILNRGGRVLMPVFALGRAQELLLILDEYWEKHPKFQQYPIYYASNLARKCMDVYRTYINTMNDKIKRAMFEGEGRNPWDFRWVRSLKNIERFDDVGGCVMLASPGMLQVGPQLLLLSNLQRVEKRLPIEMCMYYRVFSRGRECGKVTWPPGLVTSSQWRSHSADSLSLEKMRYLVVVPSVLYHAFRQLCVMSNHNNHVCIMEYIFISKPISATVHSLIMLLNGY